MTNVWENEPTLLLRIIAIALSDQCKERSSPKMGDSQQKTGHVSIERGRRPQSES